MQHRTPLHEACWRGLEIAGVLAREIDLLPRTPVAVRVVDVAAAREKLISAFSANLSFAPTRKIARIENIAVVRAFAFRPRTDDEDLSQIARRRVKIPVRRLGKSRDLVGTALQQVGEILAGVSVDGEDAAFVPSPGQQIVIFVESERVDQAMVRRPQPPRRSIRRDL